MGGRKSKRSPPPESMRRHETEAISAGISNPVKKKTEKKERKTMTTKKKSRAQKPIVDESSGFEWARKRRMLPKK